MRLKRGLSLLPIILTFLAAWPCQGKAVIRQWGAEPSLAPSPEPSSAVYNPLPSSTPLPQAVSRLPVQAVPNRSIFGIRLAYYGSNPGLFAKGAFGSLELSPLLRVQAGVLAGNTSILVPTSANLYEYSSFLRIPVSLLFKFYCLYGGLQVAHTWVDTYNHPSYGITSFEPILGIAWEPGPLHLALDVSYPPFDPAIPPIVSLGIGGRF